MTALDAAAGAFAILALVLGGLAVLRLVRQVSWSPLWASSWPARLALAHLVGSAVMAWVVTVLGLVAGRLLVWPVYCLFAAAAIAGYIRRRAPAQRPGPPQPQRPPERGGFWMWFAMGAVAIAVAVTGWQLAGQRVLAIDAYTMWEKKAKAFYIAGSFTPLLANCCDQVHFPVLWSLQPWWVYKHLHHTDERWMAILGFVFYLDLLALTFSACRAYMRPEWAWTATALVANDPAMSLLVTSGFAEVPLAAYILASSVCLFAYLSLRQQSARIPALLLLLGALQTKNEGFAWAVFGVALAVFFELRWKRPRTAAWTFGLFAIAAAPWMLFKHLHAMKATLDEPLATLPPFGLAWLHRLVAIVPMASQDVGISSLLFLAILCLPLILTSRTRAATPVLALLGVQVALYFGVCFLVQDAIAVSFVGRGMNQVGPALLCISLIAYFLPASTARRHRQPSGAVSPVAAVPRQLPPTGTLSSGRGGNESADLRRSPRCRQLG